MIICRKSKKNTGDTHVTTVDDDDYRGLISSTVRLKTWTYLMLAKYMDKLYGSTIRCKA